MGKKTIYQFGRGHEILVEVARQVNKALQGHRIYFFPAGGALIGYKKGTMQQQFLIF